VELAIFIGRVRRLFNEVVKPIYNVALGEIGRCSAGFEEEINIMVSGD
jgi:hypothetical protein